jgi:4-hydroxybenzoate polyprenyltransferase
MNLKAIAERLTLYERLMRLNKPIGTLLLLWPTLWALWIAGDGRPSLLLVWIFAFGTLLMRSAGCVMNDLADRDFDKHVKRTKDRPLTTGQVSAKEALILAGLLSLCAFGLIIKQNKMVWALSVVALFLAATYPLTKRFFAIPQAYLGIAFGFGIPMAFAAIWRSLPPLCWWLLAANIFWAIAYDTEYAMVDRDDDVRLGLKTSAITFGNFDVGAVMLCYTAMFGILAYVGFFVGLGIWYWLGLIVAMGMALYHNVLIRERTREGCFKAFMHNNWLGAAIFLGILLDYGLGQKTWPML